MLRSVLPCLCLLLAACQAPNPYTAASLPEAAERRDFDASAYPAPPRDYASYRTWRWQQEPAGSDDLHTAVASGLERLGLRQSRDAQADLFVRVGLHQAHRLEQYVEPYAGYHGYPHHYGIWATGPRVYSYRREVLVVDIELFDRADGQPIWRGQGESPAEDARRDRLYQAVREALSGFPP